MRSIVSSSSSDQSHGRSRNHLYLNIYDLTPLNNYMYWFGVGIYHSGIEAYGVEYAFGAHDYPTSGVFEVEPKSCPGFLFRRSISLGTTDMSSSEFRQFIEHMAGSYNGDSYHLIAKNCNHFTNDVCMRLTAKCIPGWVNRLARIGSFCNCLLPESIQVTAVQHIPDYQELSDQGISEDESESRSTQGFVESDGEQDHQLLISNTAEGLSFTNHIKEVL
ncbi:hypothetical protein SUGI_0586620 [Cryptomeria japonica]|uniref:deSI-like protein At4g17486 n=1 Tax=Cryptomeria japonica TaxID=3369 RepID=UPI002414BC3C|nr:deSI-like protein At4g17486 [Cryptomeria japonica]GLJ29730.1 hypothetical protein SUGI_0586620 [Cryptomeria japonica]